MKAALWIAFAVIWLAIVWFMIIHPLLHRWHVTHHLFELLDARHASSWAQFRVAVSGLKRMIFTRLVWITGFMLSMHDLVLTNVTYVEPFIPVEYRQYLLPTIMLIGVMTEVLNRISQQPVGEISPQVLAEATSQPLDTVVAATLHDPDVGIPTQQQVATGVTVAEEQRKADGPVHSHSGVE